jgi:hypothetical protein
MNEEAPSGDRPQYLLQGAGAEGRQAEEALARARYEQSHPGKSHRRTQPPTPSTWPQSGLKDSMDLSHAGSSASGAESIYSYDTSRDLSNYFREINGRKFSSQASTYMLPAGE